MSEKKKEKRHYGAGCSSELQKRAFFHRIALEGQEKKKERERKKHCGEEGEGEESAVNKKKSPILLFVLRDYY